MDFDVMVSNLDRRRDRWLYCLGWLRALGISEDRITRFSAHDGKDYDSPKSARAAAMAMFPNSAYLDCPPNPTNYYYFWNWTWYDMLFHVASQPRNAYTLVMVDDVVVNCAYNEMCSHISQLSHECDALKMIQYVESSQTPRSMDGPPSRAPGQVVPGTPFRRGLCRAGDHANLLSPTGAKEMMRVADQHTGVCPNVVVWHAGRDLESVNGYFSPLENVWGVPLSNAFIDRFQDARRQ